MANHNPSCPASRSFAPFLCPLYPASIRGTLLGPVVHLEDGRTRGSEGPLFPASNDGSQGVCFSGNLDNAADIAILNVVDIGVDRFSSTAYELYVQNPS